MKKTTKSVRLDDDIIELIDNYCKFRFDVFGAELTFSNIVTSAIVSHLEHEIGFIKHLMETQSFVETLPNGKMRRLTFTDEQIQRISELEESATYFWALDQSGK